MMRPKIVWNWAEWSDEGITRVWLPQLHLSRLPGKTTLCLAGEFTAFDPPRLTDLACELIRVIWDVPGAATATVDWAPKDEAQPVRTDTYGSLEELVGRLDGLFACDENYIVQIGPFTFAEQDGDMLNIEAPRQDLQRLFDAVASRAEASGWTFIDVVDD